MTAADGRRSAVIVAVPGAAAAVNGWRERTCSDRPSIGVPAHVTLVVPFVPPVDLDAAVETALADVVRGEPVFRFGLREARRFPGVLYLAPEPPEPFVRLTRAIVRRFPEFLPYEGAFDAIVPHLTVALGDDGVLGRAEAEVVPLLPIAAEAREAMLLVETEVDAGRWEVRARLPLGSAGAGSTLNIP